MALAAIDTVASVDPSRAVQIPQWLQAGNIHIAGVQGDIAGYRVLHRQFFGERFIALIMVAPAWRRHGVASALLADAIKDADGAKLFTSCNASNSSMQRLLQAHRFQRCGIVQGLDEGDPEWIFRHLAS